MTLNSGDADCTVAEANLHSVPKTWPGSFQPMDAAVRSVK